MNSNSNKPVLHRWNAVEDLTAIPLDTPIRIQITLEFQDPNASSPIKLQQEIGSLDRVSQLVRFASKLIPKHSQIDLYHKETLLDESCYIYEYSLRDKDTIRVIYYNKAIL